MQKDELMEFELCSPDGRQWTWARDEDAWARVNSLCETEAVGMCWDECHKIYILLDEASVSDMLSHDYVIHAPNGSMVQKWYENSCSLVFVSTIRNGGGTVHDYDDVIPQLWRS